MNLCFKKMTLVVEKGQIQTSWKSATITRKMMVKFEAIVVSVQIKGQEKCEKTLRARIDTT